MDSYYLKSIRKGYEEDERIKQLLAEEYCHKNDIKNMYSIREREYLRDETIRFVKSIQPTCFMTVTLAHAYSECLSDIYVSKLMRYTSDRLFNRVEKRNGASLRGVGCKEKHASERAHYHILIGSNIALGEANERLEKITRKVCRKIKDEKQREVFNYYIGIKIESIMANTEEYVAKYILKETVLDSLSNIYLLSNSGIVGMGDDYLTRKVS